jgi:hypothetical protein
VKAAIVDVRRHVADVQQRTWQSTIKLEQTMGSPFDYDLGLWNQT